MTKQLPPARPRRSAPRKPAPPPGADTPGARPAPDPIDDLCLNCLLRHGRRSALEVVPYRHELIVGDRRFRATLQGDRCTVCGQRSPGSGRFRYLLRIARQLADEGDRQPEAVRFIREQASLPVAELARLLGVSRQTVHRWENGQTPIDVASYAVLRLLLIEASSDEGTPLCDWLARLNGLPRRPYRHFTAKNQGRAPALERGKRGRR